MIGVFRRWTVGMASGVDRMVGKIENQEALVGSAIRSLQRSAARAKVQLARVRQDGIRLRHELADAEDAEAQWRDRAGRTASEDEARALECLRRAKQAHRKGSEFRRRLDVHAGTEEQLRKDMRAVENRLAELKEKRNLMRTRQSRAEALCTVHDVSAPMGAEIEEIFDRWECHVTEAEIESGCQVDEADSFGDEFLTQEEEEGLRLELQEIRALAE
ncbi:MAG: hypothetical protein HN742_03170 [Lentisphaerae bacterium]|jgi:phage shock protein A|nr:hypothetical protein [Lentisphaerota bacterium]MBT4822516.1 hypothetical protein [Lentisphaerota bacterium]MBT5605470.1 hypothetical protein [Lentisphaerota bacterium]MBT7060099.1 hypothetical protein [Lentisphaerota bacterium]MBT7840841.1 hypothetical protein [Lentisphaerota bacterium]